MVQPASGLVDVVEAGATTGATGVTSAIDFVDGTVDCYVYFLDKRGSNKVASISDYLSVTIV